MTPRRTRAQTLRRAPVGAVRAANEKENAPPGLKRPAPPPAPANRRTPRRPRRMNARDGDPLSPPLARRRAYYERRAADDDDADDGGGGGAGEICVADLDRGAFLPSDASRSVEMAASSSMDETDERQQSDRPPQDDLILAPEWVCDDAVSPQELATRMHAALGCLRTIPNTHDGEAVGPAASLNGFRLGDLASCLAVDRYISHSSSVIRLFTACNLAEILRISAPDPPLPLAKLNPVAALFVEQLVPLAKPDEPLSPYRIALLEQLALAKSFAVFCDDMDIVADVFAGAYALIRPHHSSKVQDMLRDILVTMLDEMENVGQVVVDAVLAPLIPSRGYTEEAVQLAEHTLRASQDALQIPICNFFNATLFRGRINFEDPLEPQLADTETEPTAEDSRRKPLQDGSEFKSELRNDFEQLLVQSIRIAPDMLLHVIPNLERDLHCKDVECRRQCVQLLSSLFAASEDMIRTYSTLLTDFIARFRDSDSKIRIQMLQASVMLVQSYPTLKEEISKRILERILDKVDDVRVAAIAAAAEIKSTSAHVLKLIAGRILDRKVIVRRAAVRALIKLYVSSPDDCRQIPQALLHSYPVLRNIQDHETAGDVETAVFNGLHRHGEMELDRSCGTRVLEVPLAPEMARSFMSLLGKIDQPALVCLRSMLEDSIRVKNIIVDISNIRLDPARQTGKQGSFSKNLPKAKDPGRIEQLAIRLAASVPPTRFGTETQEDVAQSFVGFKDLHVFKSLLRMVASSSLNESILIANEVVSRVGAKCHLGLFLRRVCSKAGHVLFALEHLDEALSFCSLASSSGREEEMAESCQLRLGGLRYMELAISYGVHRFTEQNVSIVLNLILDVSCDSFEDNRESAARSALDEKAVYRRRILICFLRIASHLPPEQFEGRRVDLENRCLQLAMGDPWSWSDPETRACVAKWATRTLISLGSLSSLISEVRKQLDGFCGSLDSLICPITSLSQLAKHAKDNYKSIALESFDFVRSLLSGFKNGLVSDHHTAPDSSGGEQSRLSLKIVCEIVRRAVKLLVYSTAFVDDEVSSVVAVLVSISTERNGDVFDLRETAMVRGDGFEDGDGLRLDSLADLNAVCRLSACCGVVYLGRNPLFYNKIHPREFLLVVLCAQDEHPDVRILFARHLCMCLQRKRLPFRWVVSLVLMAVDPDKENLTEVRAMCSGLIRQRRRAHTQALDLNKKGKDADQLLPEAAVPVLIWVLANHPDVEHDMEHGYVESEKYLDFFLDRLLENTDYTSVLIESLAQVAVSRDACNIKRDSEPSRSSEQISALAGIASTILTKKQAGRIWHIEQTCKLALPADLFRTVEPALVVDQVRSG